MGRNGDQQKKREEKTGRRRAKCQLVKGKKARVDEARKKSENQFRKKKKRDKEGGGRVAER